MCDGYGAARTRPLASSPQADTNLIVLSGDGHNARAFELPNAGAPAGAEFAVRSVTSPGNGGSIPADPAELARAYVGRNEPLKWDQEHH